MPESSVIVETSGAVVTVTLDRPECRNAVDGPTAHRLREAFEAFEADDALRVLVLTGRGGQFCAGADLKAMADPRRRNHVEPTGRAAGPMGPTRMHLGKPAIAAIEGHAVAGGLELALICDLRVAARGAVFGVLCRRWGVPLIDGGTVRLPRLIGQSRAMDMILTGRAVAADEALAIGLANRVVPKGQSRQAAEELAGQLAALPQQCMRSDRLSALHQWGMAESDALDFEFASISRVAAEANEGAGRFAAGAGRHGAPAG